MMGNRSLSLKYMFVISLLCYSFVIYSCGDDSITPFKRERVKRDLYTELGSYDLHLKTGSSRQTKLQFHSGVSALDKQWGDNEHILPGGRRGDQVQGLEQTSSDGKVHENKQDERTSRVTEKILSEGEMVYVGCFSTWEKQFTQFLTSNPSFNNDHNPLSCRSQCSNPQINQIILLRGAECLCTSIHLFDSLKIDDYNCNIHCPIRSFDPQKPPSSDPPQFLCGGNLGYSVYCAAGGDDDCSTVTEKYKPEIITIQVEKPIDDSLTLNDPCTVCNKNDNLCQRPWVAPYFDNFPLNSPEQCIEFCRKNITFIGNDPKGGIATEKVREATPYARLTWARMYNYDIPICSCLPQESRHIFVHEPDQSMCNVPCPGNPSAYCGGKNNFDNTLMYSTIYCVNPENGPCMEWREPTTLAQPTTSTTDISIDPCDNPDIDCDPNPVTSETPKPDTTETVTVTSDSTTLTTTELDDNSSTSLSSTPIVTKETSTSTTTIPQDHCNVECKGLDRYGNEWIVCSKTQKITPCSKLIPGADGHAFWKCSVDGEFESANPDVSNCSSSWIEKEEKAIEDIQDLHEADVFMENLYEKTINSSIAYFGHEIRNLTGVVNKVLLKSKDFDENFPKLERMVKRAVDLNSFLIQKREPWMDLDAPEKSTVSTNLLENMDGALFRLTDSVNLKENDQYQQIFTMINETDLYRFLILAETFDKLKNGRINESYEFPPRENRDLYDSFIKLPAGWKKLIKKDKVEIAAMSIDPEYISYIMPGQYEHLVASTNIDEDYDHNKLINGKLISLSVTSSANDAQARSTLSLATSTPRVSFAGKGAQITFYHDIEAWGAEQQNVYRKLHDGEKPKAVLGSGTCVYWNTRKHSWSSDGCKILRSNRYETVCECSHLTSFAVLMDFHRYVGKQLGLELLTLILCPASEVALILSIVILSSVNGLQRIRSMITTNLSICLLVGNALVLLVLDRNYFNMGEGLCVGAAMVTHYVFLCAFMWMLIEGIQLYRMVVHVFDSGRSYIKHFGVMAYGSPLIIIAITATTGYMRGDKPYGGDVYCWLEGSYVWSFMGPVALIVVVNMTILFIALKTAYQLQQSKKLSPTFLMGKIKSCKTWFKGCFSLTVILGLTWAVGFFMLMKGSGGVVAAYIFTILNASQGLFIFLFNCVFNDKVRAFTKRNFSTYLPSWLTSSISSNPDDNGYDASIYGKRKLPPEKSSSEKVKRRASRRQSDSNEPKGPFTIPNATLVKTNDPSGQSRSRKSTNDSKVDFIEARNHFISTEKQNHVERSESVGTISSLDSIPASSASDNGHISSDTSQSALISKIRAKN